MKGIGLDTDLGIILIMRYTRDKSVTGNQVCYSY